MTDSDRMQVPQQPNFSDCGLYLIHYTKQLLNNQLEILRFIEVSFSDEFRRGMFT